MKKFVTIVFASALTLAAMAQSEAGAKVSFTSGPVAEEEPESDFGIDLGADLVSSYVWRGQYCSPAAFQPNLTASYKNLSLGAWGSTDFRGDCKEFDFSLFYAPQCGLSVGVTDYFIGSDSGERLKYFNRKSRRGGHAFEGTLAYSHSCGFGVSWNTFFANDDDYSTYVGLSYDFSVKTVDCSASVGVSPWKGQYSDEFHVADVAFKAQKTVGIRPNFALGIYAQAIWSPSRNDAHFVAGISF